MNPKQVGAWMTLLIGMSAFDEAIAQDTARAVSNSTAARPAQSQATLGTSPPWATGPLWQVRVHHGSTCCTNPVRGVLVSISADSVVLRNATDGQLVGLPRSAVRLVEHRYVLGSHRFEGSVFGLIAGAGLGYLIGSRSHMVCVNRDGYTCAATHSLNGAVGFVLGAPVGLVAGLIVGGRIPLVSWDPVALP